MENKKKLIALVIGIILIILVGELVFYLTSHLTKTTICKGKLDMITTEEVEVISSDEKVKETISGSCAYRSYGSNYSPVPWPHRTLRTSQLRLSYKARRNSYKSTFILHPSFVCLSHFSVISVHYTGCLYILPVLFSHYRLS